MHRFVNDLERPVGTFLLGRRMYETLRFWEAPPELEREPDEIRDYAEIWRRAEKIVYSRTLETAATSATRIEREFDPDAVRRLIESAGAELSVGGAQLAGEALRAGLVDECRIFTAPAIVGGGTRALPDGVRLDLELVDQRRFESGFVFCRYRL